MLIQFDPDTARDWIISSTITMAIDFFVNEPCQLLFKAMVIPFLGDMLSDYGAGEMVTIA